MDISEQTGQWLGWIGIILAVIGFFWQPVWMGIIAVILGAVGLFSDQKGLNWTATGLGIVVLIFSMV